MSEIKGDIKRVMVFGVFDRLHPGHLDFFRQAAQHGDELIAVVARDRMVEELKNKSPFHSEVERLAMVQNVSEVTLAILGDEAQGSYGVIAAHKPDVICVGYDQYRLAEDLQIYIRKDKFVSFGIKMLEPYGPKIFHTSILAEK